MKATALVVFLFMMVSGDAFSQRMPRRGNRFPGRIPETRPMPGPRYPMPAPRRPMPMNRMTCSYADLYRGYNLVHRFSTNSNCLRAIQNIQVTGKFCSGGTMYNYRGNVVERYYSNKLCRLALAL